MFFHDYVMTWWQAGLLKVALLALGILIGASWPGFFKKPGLWLTLWVLWLVLFILLLINFWPQI